MFTNGVNAVEISFNIPDTNPFPNERFTKGNYLTIQAINDNVSARTQFLTIFPGGFPSGTVINWTWPNNADTSVKSWNAIDFGNYFGTVVPVPIVPSKISNISTLTETHDFTYTSTADSANVALDFFLWSKPDSQQANMLCEIEVFFHTPNSTKGFIDGLTSLGTYTSAAIGGAPSITWNVGRQASNFFGTPYYLLYPSDQNDKPSITFDIKALLAFLSVSNPTTGLTYLTGNEYYNGHGFGVEAMLKSGSLTVNNLVNNYVVTAPTNLISATPSQVLTDSFWTGGNVTVTPARLIETSATGSHGVSSTTGISKTASSINYVCSFDVDIAFGRTWCFVQCCTPDFGATGSVQQYFDVGNNVVGNGGTGTGSYTLYSASVVPIGNGSRVTVVFNAGISGVGAQDTAMLVIFRIATANFTQSYTGDITKGMNVSNVQLYQI